MMAKSPTSSPRPGGEGRPHTATPMPVLASEVLREDVAPLAPWRNAFRLWDVVFAVAMVGMGVGVHWGLIPATLGSPWIEYGVGVVLLILGAIPGGYLARGIVSMVLAGLVAALGLLGAGPLGNWITKESGMLVAVLQGVTMATLPAALLFRNRYPAYGGARIALLIACFLALPTVLLGGFAVVEGPLWASIAAGATLAVVALSLVGFLGEGTTGYSTILAILMIVVFGAARMSRPLWSRGWEVIQVDLRAGLSLMVVAAMASIGIFSILSSIFAKDARRVDVMRVKPPPPLNRISGVG